MSQQPPKFNEAAAVEQIKEHLLNAIRGEGVQNVNPSQDALNYAAAYKYVIDAEKVRVGNVDK